MNQYPRMKPFWYWFCVIAIVSLDWIPGYCRYYLASRISAGTKTLVVMERHWAWQWSAQWGFRLVARLGMLGSFHEECERREAQENRSSRS